VSSLPRESVVLRERREEDADAVFDIERDERRYVGYWIERSHHGRGIASTALAQFIRTIDERPLWAWVAEDNTVELPRTNDDNV
jgi:hypothetical protein